MNLPTPLKNVIRWRSALTRAREALPLLVTVFLLSAGLGTPVAAIFKFFPSLAGWGVSQHAANPAIGMFQGAVAGVFWGGVICAGITLYDTVFGNIKKKSSVLHPIGAIVFGSVSGLLGAIVITACVLGVFNESSLLKMGWLPPAPASALGAGAVAGSTLLDRVVAAFQVTGFGWVNLITGTALGCGMALMTNAIRSTPQWQRLLQHDTAKIESVKQLRQTLWRIAALSWPWLWLLLLPILLGAGIAFHVPDIVTYANAGTQANPWALGLGLLGDCSTQFVGAFWAIAGMLLATVIVRHGISIDKAGD